VDFESEEFFKMVQENILREWKNSNKFICVDESIVPHQGRHNPHHVFIKRKPNPHGIKLFTAADDSCYIFSIKPSRRTMEEPEDQPLMQKKKPAFVRGDPCRRKHVHDTVINLLNGVNNEGHIVVADSYFGGVKTLETLKKNGFESIMTCNSNRPSSIFKNRLHKKLKDRTSSFCQLEADSNFYYSAFSINRSNGDSNKISNILSTVHQKLEFVKVSTLTRGSNNERVEKNGEIPTAYNDYLKASGYIDNANKYVMNTMYRFRCHRWRQAVFCWVVSLFAHNARCLCKNESTWNGTQSEYCNKISEDLFHIESPSQNEHKLISIEKRDYCRCCYWKTKIGEKKVRKKVKNKCNICGVMCKNCFDSPNHGDYHFHIQQCCKKKKFIFRFGSHEILNRYRN
jgi:hypothetical protein